MIRVGSQRHKKKNLRIMEYSIIPKHFSKFQYVHYATVFLTSFIFAHLVKNCPSSAEHDGILPRSQEPAIELHLQAFEFTPHSHTLFL